MCTGTRYVQLLALLGKHLFVGGNWIFLNLTFPHINDKCQDKSNSKLCGDVYSINIWGGQFVYDTNLYKLLRSVEMTTFSISSCHFT